MPTVRRKAKILAQMSVMQKNFAAGHKNLLEGMKVGAKNMYYI
jgi:hypothetical protein